MYTDRNVNTDVLLLMPLRKCPIAIATGHFLDDLFLVKLFVSPAAQLIKGNPESVGKQYGGIHLAVVVFLYVLDGSARDTAQRGELRNGKAF